MNLFVDASYWATVVAQYDASTNKFMNRATVGTSLCERYDEEDTIFLVIRYHLRQKYHLLIEDTISFDRMIPSEKMMNRARNSSLFSVSDPIHKIPSSSEIVPQK